MKKHLLPTHSYSSNPLVRRQVDVNRIAGMHRRLNGIWWARLCWRAGIIIMGGRALSSRSPASGPGQPGMRDPGLSYIQNKHENKERKLGNINRILVVTRKP